MKACDQPVRSTAANLSSETRKPGQDAQQGRASFGPDAPAAAINVFIVEDHRCVLWGLEKLVDSERPRMRVVGTANNRAETLRTVRLARPDIILLDLDLDGDNSLDFLPDLLAQTPARVLVLTGCRDTGVRERAAVLGASGIVLKDEPAHVLVTAIERVHRGELWLDRATIARVLGAISQGGAKSDPDQRNIASLTPKEREIINAVFLERGANSKSIAAHLHISEHTLRNHLTSIYRKLDVKNRVELVIYAREHGIVDSRAE